jgi:hypothetical protein
MRQLFKSNRESLRSIAKNHCAAFLILIIFFCNREFENSPQLRRSRVHFAGFLSETTQMPSTFMPDRLSNKCLWFLTCFFTDSPCCTDGANVGWGQLQLLHAASQRLRSPPSPPQPQPMLLRAPQHTYYHDNRFTHTDDRPPTPVGAEVQRKYQRMLALVEER